MIQKRNRKAYVLTIIICLILIGVAAPVAFCYESPCTTTNCDPEDWISEHDNKFVHPETGCTFDVHYRYRICYDSQTGEAKFDLIIDEISPNYVYGTIEEKERCDSCIYNQIYNSSYNEAVYIGPCEPFCQ